MAPRGPSQALLRAALRTQPDERLLRLGREGGEAAGEEIVRRYRQPLVRFAASIVPPQRAEDVVHDALGRALAALGRGEEVERLRPWLYAIVRNAALNDLRDQPPPHEQIDDNYDGVEQPPQALERRTRLRELVAAVQDLPPAQREALVRRELEGRSHEEIATALEVSPGSARQLIFRAREALRQGLGSLLPMPLLRQLVESGDGGAVAAGAAGGGAVAAKAAVALIAAGAVVGGGLAAREANRVGPKGDPPAAEAAAIPSPLAGFGSAGAAAERRPRPAEDLGGGARHRSGDRTHGSGDGKHESDRGTEGPGNEGPDSDGGRSHHAGAEQGEDGSHGGRSPHGGSSGSGSGESGGGSGHNGSGRGDRASDDGAAGETASGGGSDDGGQTSSGELSSGGSGAESVDGGSSSEDGSSGSGSGEQPVAAEPPPPSPEMTTSDDSRDSGSGDGSHQ